MINKPYNNDELAIRIAFYISNTSKRFYSGQLKMISIPYFCRDCDIGAMQVYNIQIRVTRRVGIILLRAAIRRIM